jgi:oligoendopeptidase F
MTSTTDTTTRTESDDELPRWSVADVHESLDARSFVAELERVGADTARLVALFDEHDVRAVPSRAVTAADGEAADRVIREMNDVRRQTQELSAYVHAFVSTNSYDEQAQAIADELRSLDTQLSPLLSRLVEWVAALGVDALATVSTEAAEHLGPRRQLAQRAEHQMSEVEEGLYAELAQTGSTAWTRLHGDVTSQLHATVAMPDGSTKRLPMAAVRGLANDTDPRVRQAAYDAEMDAWPTVAVVCAAALNSVKGEAIAVNRRRTWASALDASLYANNVSRPTFDAMQAAVSASLPDFRRWMRTKARLHGDAEGGLRWRDLVAPLPGAPSHVTWEEGLAIVRHAFSSYGGSLGGLVDRAIDERWVDASPRDGKRGGAFCMSFVGDRSLVFLNWNGSLDATQTTAHELGHAYHNTQLAGRAPLQRRLPMALAETASIFCETLVVEEGLQRLQGAERLALLDVDLQGANQVVVDIHSRFLFESELFARRQRRTLGVSDLNELMREAQRKAYGDGLDQATAHPFMWAVKGHYYGSHFYNWPYTYGLLFGLGLFARYRDDPDRFRDGYDDLLSRVGMNTAEELGQEFDIDVTDEAFWTASLDVLRARIAEYEQLASHRTVSP